MKATTFRIANFGPHAFDLRSGELRKFGSKVKMGEQPFRILCMLLETPGEMVTREELRAKLWSDDTFVDFDHGLNSAVQRLRDCLSDSAGKPRSAKDYVSPFELAQACAGLRKREEALRYLEESYRERAPWLVHLQHDPSFDLLRGEPRYRAIVIKMGLQPTY